MQQGRGSGQGCSDFIARASRALQLERVARRLGFSPKLHCATGAVARAGNVAWAILLLQRRGLTAVASSSKRWAAVRGHRSGQATASTISKPRQALKSPLAISSRRGNFYQNQWLFPFELLQNYYGEAPPRAAARARASRAALGGRCSDAARAGFRPRLQRLHRSR